MQISEKNQNRTFAQTVRNQYDKGRKQPERSKEHERNHLHETGRLSYSRPDITDRARNSAWQIRYDAQGLSGAEQENHLPQSADIGQTERTSLSDRTDSTYEVGASDEAAMRGTGRDGGTERESTDAMGRTDEQYPQPSGGNHPERTDLQLEEAEPQGSIANENEVRATLPTVEEQMERIAEAEDEKSSAFSVSQEDIDSVLTKGSNFENGKYRIYRQFRKLEDSKKNIEFLRNEYGTGGGTHFYPDGTSGHQWHDGKGILIEKQDLDTKLLLSWSKVEKRLRELIKNDRYLNPKEKEHYPDYLEKENAPQYEIDIQRKIQRQNFINAKLDLPPADKRDTLSLRLSDFIRDLDGYEKELLSNVERTDLSDVTNQQMEQHLSGPATVQQLVDFLKLVQGKTSDTYSRSNAWSFHQELLELYPLRYLYHEGDVVYLGADKYEVQSVSEDSVTIQNVQFPILIQAYSYGELSELLKQNPANDHLKVIVTEKQKTETPSEKKPDSLKLSIGFSEHPAFYDRELNNRFTDLSFALGNKLLGVLDEKQHCERGGDKNIGWYHKTDFEIAAVIGGEDFRYEGRFDIGDGEGDLIAHIRNFYDYSLSPDCPFLPEWKKQGEDYYREKIESLQWGRDVLIPYLEQNKVLTPEDEKLFDEIMATEKEWFVSAEDKEATLAGRLADFVSDVSPYEYMDALEVGETDEDAVRKISNDLTNSESIQSYIEALQTWIEELEDIEELETCRQLIQDLTALREEKIPHDTVEQTSDAFAAPFIPTSSARKSHLITAAMSLKALAKSAAMFPCVTSHSRTRQASRLTVWRKSAIFADSWNSRQKRKYHPKKRHKPPQSR